MSQQRGKLFHTRLKRYLKKHGLMVPKRERLAIRREILDSRYDDLKSGRVAPIDGETFFAEWRERQNALR